MKPRDERVGAHGGARVMASAPSVVQQARLMDAAGTAWHAVKCGNLEMITKLFPVPCNVYARGPVGENVMHVAMLLNTPSTLAITRYLVKLYGRQLVNCPIQERKQLHDPPGTYEGQTALHIAIVNRDFDMVKFLVQNGADIRARAWGTCFRQGGPMYYGEYALSFAACTGQKDVVAYLRRHGAQVNSDCDDFGNTALHMCVIHDQADMYDFLVEYCAASEAVRNHCGLSPLCLAAQLGKADMLQHVYNRRRRAFYSFGKVTSYSLSLREIDTVQDEDEAAGPDGGYVPNALEAVLRKRHLDMLQEPLLTLLLQHKWEKFARAQFVVHFLGYLLLEVSQTILIWMHSNPVLWNGPGRASQEFLGIIFALALLAVEVLDYVNWSRECYHRRLTMTVQKEMDPPLYPIPGEMRDARDNRQGLFARLSARMGFAANSSGTQQSAPGGWQQRSEGGLATPRAAVAAAAAAAAAPRGVSHPGGGFGFTGSSAPKDRINSAESAAAAAAATGVRPQGGTTHRLSLQAVNDTQPQQPPSPPRGAGTRRTAKPSSSRTTPASSAAAAASPGTPSRSTAAAAAAAAAAAVSAAAPSSFSRAGGGGQVAPSRSTQQINRESPDDPIDLRPKIGSAVGEGASLQGVGVVDTGYGTLAMPPTGEEAATGESAGFGSSSIGLPAGPGPVAEAIESDGDDASLLSTQQQQQQQQQQARTLAAAYQQGQRIGATGEPLALSATSSRLEDEDEGFDPVSVGLNAGRIWSQSHLSAGISGVAQHSTASAAAAAAAAASAVGVGEASGVLLPTVTSSGSGAGSRSVTFSEGPNALLAARAAGSRLNSPRLSSITQQQQVLQQLQQQQGSASVPVQQPQASAWQHNADGSSSGSSAAAGGLAVEAAAGHRDPSALRGLTISAGSSSSPAEGAAVWPDSAAVLGAQTAGVAGSPSFKQGMPRAKSFHGIGAGLAGVSSVRQGLVTAEDGVSMRMPRPQSAGDEMLQNLATSSMPADPIDAVQMLERQRTRARSGGGDLPAALALKRTPASKKERPSSMLSGRSSVSTTAADGSADGAGGGGGGGGFLATASTETGSFKLSDMERGPEADILDPHKSRLRAMLETTYEGAVRMLEDPWLFIWHLHLLLTCMHFLIWISSYGWIGGSGPKSIRAREFDDVIVSMMGLSGWLAVIYFFRGLPSTGKLAVLLERCIVDVVKFVSLYVLWNLGFTLAFFTMQNGVLSVAPNAITRNTLGLVELSEREPDPFSSIGNTMVTLVNLGSGLSHYEYAMTCKNDYVLSSVLCTIYYLLYMATVVLLLMNLLIAMIIKTWHTTQEAAESYWKHRWAIYVIKAERRLSRSWLQRLRLGQLTYDPVSDKRVHSHVFETVDDDRAAESSKAAVDGQIKVVEQLLDELRKRRGS